MKLNLGQLKCIYCESEDLRCYEWYPDLEEEDPEDWYLEKEVPDYAQHNFSKFSEIVLIVNCEHCQQWFKFEAEAKEIGTSNLKISKKAGDLESAILEFDPVEQAPKAIIIKNFRFEVFSYSVTRSTPRFSRSGIGYFYPYPKGSFHLHCRVQHQNALLNFKCILSNKYIPPIITSSEEDISFYKIPFEWVDNKGIELIEKLSSKNCTQDENDLLDSIRSDHKTITKDINRIASISRNLQAYRFLNWFENELRIFVWEVYIRKHNPADTKGKWWKSVFPEEVRNNIQKSNEGSTRLKLGQKSYSHLPLDYADFHDLMTLIEKEWGFITQSHNSNLKALQGHFEYLKHSRNAIAHSRFLSHDDLMLLQDNSKRFTELIGAKFLKEIEFPFYRNPTVFF